MIDSTPAASGAVVDEGTARSPQPMVEADAGRQAEEAREDALAQPGHGAGPVALQGEQFLAAPEDRLDALTDGGQVGTVAGFVLARRAHDEGAQLGRSGREVAPGVALVAEEHLAAAARAAREQFEADLALVTLRRGQLERSRRWPITATAPPIRAGSGACACTSWPPPTARRERSSWPRRSVTSARSASNCSRAARAAAARCSSATRATPGATSRPLRPSWAPSSCARRARTNPATVLTWPPSVSASSRSSGAARNCSPWSATGPAPWPGCASASSLASSAWRPASASTIGWGERAVPSSTTAPEAAG